MGKITCEQIRVEAFRNTRELLVNKALAVMLGWCLMRAIRRTLSGWVDNSVGAGNWRTDINITKTHYVLINGTLEPKTDEAKLHIEDLWVNLVLQLLTFIMLLMFAVLLIVIIKSLPKCFPKIPPLLRDTWVAGMSLIPIWSWKTFIEALMWVFALTIDHHEYNSFAEPNFQWKIFGFQLIFTICVFMLSAAIQIASEIICEHFLPESYAFNVGFVLKTSLGLAAGWALDRVVQVIFRKYRSGLIFGLLYAIFATLFILFVNICFWPQVQKKCVDAHCKRDKFGFWTKVVTFVMTAGNFVIAWAIYGFCLLISLKLLEGSDTSAILGQLLVSFSITILGILVVVAFSIFNTLYGEKFKIPPGIFSTLKLVVGIVCGWTWNDFIIVVYAVVRRNYGSEGQVWVVWILSLCIVVLMVIFELLFHCCAGVYKEHAQDIMPGQLTGKSSDDSSDDEGSSSSGDE